MESKIAYSTAGSHHHGDLASTKNVGSYSTTQYFTSKYIRHSRAVAILWSIFTLCAAILNIVVFMSPNWVGDTSTSKGPGHFGLWKFCTVLSADPSSSEILNGSNNPGNVVCIGDLNNFASILSPAFRAATVFVGLSVIVMILCLLGFLLFCFMKANSVFEICGTMQFLSGICMAIGILAFPAGWDNDHVRGICGQHSEDYQLGDCGIRWAFVLAIIAFFDSWILGCLAFTLAHRTVRPQAAEPQYMNPASIYKGEVNSAFVGDTQSLTGSRKSLSLQPVMMMPHPTHGHGPPVEDGYSEFSQRTGRSNPNSPYRGNPYGPSIQNFQL